MVKDNSTQPTSRRKNIHDNPLALVTGAPILADSALLDDPRVTRRPDWRDFPSGTAALAAEAREWLNRFPVSSSPQVGPGGQGEVQQ